MAYMTYCDHCRKARILTEVKLTKNFSIEICKECFKKLDFKEMKKWTEK
jgi:hypothetical protein